MNPFVDITGPGKYPIMELEHLKGQATFTPGIAVLFDNISPVSGQAVHQTISSQIQIVKDILEKFSPLV